MLHICTVSILSTRPERNEPFLRSGSNHLVPLYHIFQKISHHYHHYARIIFASISTWSISQRLTQNKCRNYTQQIYFYNTSDNLALIGVLICVSCVLDLLWIHRWQLRCFFEYPLYNLTEIHGGRGRVSSIRPHDPITQLNTAKCHRCSSLSADTRLTQTNAKSISSWFWDENTLPITYIGLWKLSE